MEIVSGFSKLSREEKIAYIQNNFPLAIDLAKETNHYRHKTNQATFDDFSENTLRCIITKRSSFSFLSNDDMQKSQHCFQWLLCQMNL